MKLKWKKRLTAVAAASYIAWAVAPASAAQKQAGEAIPAWVAAEFADWQSLGLLHGNEKGELLPDQMITKAEFVAFINRVFHYAATSSQSFADVSEDAWYASDIKKAAAAGLIVGEGNGTAAPLDILTREKAAIILYKAYQLPPAAKPPVKFSDDGQISAWAKEAVYALKEGGYIAGMPDGAFSPKKGLSRAEAVKMINNAMGRLIADSRPHTGIEGTNLVVNAAGGSLSNVTLTGNLYVAPGVGDGDLLLDNVKVGGTIYVNGGGEHTVTMKDSKAGQIVVNKPASAVRLLLIGSTMVSSVQVLSSVQLVNDTTNEIANVSVDGDGSGTFGLSGPIGQLNLNAQAQLNIEDAAISGLTVSQSGGGSITLGTGATIGNFTANGSVSVVGGGKISQAVINASGVSLEMRPGSLTVNADEAMIGGQTVKKGESIAPIGGGSSGSGIDSGNDPGPRATKLYSYDEALGSFKSSGAEGLVKTYIGFLQDETYTPSIANPQADVPSELTNAKTFVNYQFTVKPSIFPSLRDVHASVLDSSRTYLWIGTDSGVTKIDLRTNAMKTYDKAGKQLSDDNVLLLILDGSKGVFVITDNGVSHIYQ